MNNDFFQPRDTKRSLPIALLRAREAVMAHFRPMLQQHGITEQQWRVIRVLAEDEELEVSQLAARAFILGPSLSRILRTLEGQNMVKKRKDDRDGRRFWLSLTKKGYSLIDDIQPDSVRIYGELESKLGEKRVNKLLQALDTLTVRLDRK